MHTFCHSVSRSGGMTLVIGPRHLLFGRQKGLPANWSRLQMAAVAFVTAPVGEQQLRLLSSLWKLCMHGESAAISAAGSRQCEYCTW